MVCPPRNVMVQVLVQSTAAAIEEENIKYAHCEIASLCPHPSPDIELAIQVCYDMFDLSLGMCRGGRYSDD